MQAKKLAPDVRQIDYGERDSLIPVYKKVRLGDIVISPGAHTPERDMMNDMLYTKANWQSFRTR